MLVLIVAIEERELAHFQMVMLKSRNEINKYIFIFDQFFFQLDQIITITKLSSIVGRVKLPIVIGIDEAVPYILLECMFHVKNMYVKCRYSLQSEKKIQNQQETMILIAKIYTLKHYIDIKQHILISFKVV